MRWLRKGRYHAVSECGHYTICVTGRDADKRYGVWFKAPSYAFSHTLIGWYADKFRAELRAQKHKDQRMSQLHDQLEVSTQP